MRCRPLAMLLAATAVSFVAPLAATSPAGAALPRPLALTYLPNGFVSSPKSDAQVDGYLADLDGYGIGQLMLELPGLKRNGTLVLSATHHTMIGRWEQRAADYASAHGVSFELNAVINARVNGRTNLKNAATRANIVSAVEALITGDHVDGIHLDLEPYPTGPEYLSLLDELHARFDAIGFTGRLSVVAPQNFNRWDAARWAAVGARVTQVDPLFYDSEITDAAAYETWVSSGLAQISSAVPAPTLIVPVVAAYKPNKWHDPAVENVNTGAIALGNALAAGARIHGAGVWWWWGLFYDEGGKYDGSADRAAWQSQIRPLDYTPAGT